MKKYKCPYCEESAPNLLKHVAESCAATKQLRVEAKKKVHIHKPQQDRKKP